MTDHRLSSWDLESSYPLDCPASGKKRSLFVGLNISHSILQTPTLKANMIQFDGIKDSEGKIVECVAW